LSEYLTNTDIAREYLARGGYVSADHLVKWMNERGIGHRDAAKVAVAVNELVVSRPAQQIATPEEIAWSQNLAQGTTADDAMLQRADELALAGQVAQMDLATYGANRERFGLSQSLGDFLLGQH
jgi:hypothetical protein